MLRTIILYSVLLLPGILSASATNHADNLFDKNGQISVPEDSDYTQPVIIKKILALLPAGSTAWEAVEEGQAYDQVTRSRLTVYRVYKNNKKLVRIAVVDNMDLATSITSSLQDPGGVAMLGARYIRIKGYPAMLQYNPERNLGNLQWVAGKRAIISVTGKDINEDTLIQFARQVDSNRIELLDWKMD